jgi:hypothetical protein
MSGWEKFPGVGGGERGPFCPLWVVTGREDVAAMISVVCVRLLEDLKGKGGR